MITSFIVSLFSAIDGFIASLLGSAGGAT